MLGDRSGELPLDDGCVGFAGRAGRGGEDVKLKEGVIGEELDEAA